MSAPVDWSPPHIGDLIEAEIIARDWTRDRLAYEMTHDARGYLPKGWLREYEINLLSIDTLFAARSPEMEIDVAVLARALDVPESFLDAIHKNWQRAQS